MNRLLLFPFYSFRLELYVFSDIPQLSFGIKDVILNYFVTSISIFIGVEY